MKNSNTAFTQSLQLWQASCLSFKYLDLKYPGTTVEGRSSYSSDHDAATNIQPDRGTHYPSRTPKGSQSLNCGLNVCKLSCAHSIRQRGSSPCPQRLPKKQQPLPRTGSPRPVHSLKRRRRSLTAQAGRPSSLPPGRGGSEPGRVPPRAGTGRKAAGSSAWLRRSAGQRQRGAEFPPAGRPENGQLASPLLREGEPARRTPPGISPLIRAAAGSPVRRRFPSGGARRGRRSRGAPGLPRRERPPVPRAAAGLTARPPLRRPYPQDVVALGAPAGDLDALRGAHGRARAAARLPHKAPRTGDVALAPSLSLPLPPGSGAGE